MQGIGECIQNLSCKADALPGLPLKSSSYSQKITGIIFWIIHITFSVSYVSPHNQPLPQAIKIFLTAQASPSVIHITLITYLIKNNRFLINILHRSRPSKTFYRCLVLYTGMSVFRFPIFIILSCISMNGA